MPSPADARPLAVVLPLGLGDPTAEVVLAAVTRLVPLWPAEASLTVVGVLTARHRETLSALDGDVRLVDVPPGTILGPAVVQAVAGFPGRFLVLDPAALPADLAEVLRRAPRGRSDAVAGDATALASVPAVEHARNLASLGALVEAARGSRPTPVRLPAPGPVEDAVDVVVLCAADDPGLPECLQTLRRDPGAAVTVAVVDPLDPGAVEQTLLAGTGAAVVVLEGPTVLSGGWARQVLDALAQGAAACAPVPADPAEPDTGGGRTPAERRARAGRFRRLPTVPATGPLVGPVLAVRRDRLAGALSSGVPAEALTTTLSTRLHAAAEAQVALGGVLAQPVSVSASPRWRPLLSVGLIVRDEQDLLAPCLAAVAGIADEVVVCDTGSTDASREIAVAMGARVVEFVWVDDFAAARNAARAACTGVWTLSVDADELLVVDDRAALRAALRSSSAGVHAVRIDNLDGTGTVAYSHPGDRLFRTAEHHWVGAVHERPVRARDSAPVAVAPLDGLHLLHTGYTPELVAARDKGARNLRLAESDFAAVCADPGHPRFWKTAYELGRTLDHHDDPRSPDLLALALAHMPSDEPGLRAVALVKCGAWALRAGDLVAAEDRAREALRTVPDEPGAALLLADVLDRGGRAAEAVALLAGLGPAPVGLADVHARTVRVPVRLAGLHLGAGRPGPAATLLREVLAGPGLPDAGWADLLRALHGLGPDGWAQEVATLAGADHARVAAVACTLPPSIADPVAAALSAPGTDAWSRELDRLVADATPDAVAATATELETADPATALALWERLGATRDDRAVGRARCLVALGREGEAHQALSLVEPGRLAEHDRVLAAALALGAGEPDRVRALLAEVRDPAFRPEADLLVSLLPAPRAREVSPTGA